MCRVPVKLRELVKQRLAAAAEEIFELLERTIAEYEEETERQRRLLDKLLQPRVVLNRTAESPEPPQVKEEQEVLHSDIITSQLCSDVKTEDTAPPSAKWGVSEPAHVKEEQEGESSGQEALHSDIIRSQLCSGEKREEQLSAESPEPPQVKEEQEVLHSDIITSQLCSDVKTEDTAPPSEFEEVIGVSVKIEEEETQIDIVPLPPPGGALLHLDKRSAHSDQNHRGVSKSYVCTNCDKAFSSRSLLERHMQVHTGKKPFSCSVCGKRFSWKSNLQNHMVIHTGKKPFSCSVCWKSFSRKCNLQTHMRVHTGEKPFSCSVCRRRFSQKHTLQSHMGVHKTRDTAVPDRKKPSCQSCGKVFRCESDLKRHVVVHTGEKPFSCSVCGKRFSQKVNLQSHMIVHTGECPFSCSVCGKSVKFIRNLKRHMALHKSRVTDRAEGAQDKTRTKLGLNQD